MAEQNLRVGVQLRPAGQRGAEDRGLGEARGLLDALERVVADDLADREQQVGPQPRDLLAHAGDLAALPGEQIGAHRASELHACAWATRVPPPTPRPGGLAPTLVLRRQPEPLRALDRLGPVAHAELAIQPAGVLLDGVRREEQLRGDLAVGRAGGDQLEDLALARREPRRRLVRARLEDRHPQRDETHGVGDVTRRPVLGHEATGARGARGRCRDPPGAGYEQHLGARRDLLQALADLRARFRAHEQVQQRDVGLVTPREFERLGLVARRQAALDPVLRPQQRAQTPMDDVVVVDDENAQALLAHDSSSGIISRARQPPRDSVPNYTTAPWCSASSAASRRPIPDCRGAPVTPSLATWSTNAPRSCATATSIPVGRACLRAL